MKDLKQRTKNFTLNCWKLCFKIPKSREYDAWVRQLIRSSSSAAANYRAANRVKSDRDFINKLKIVEEEVDESSFWLEILKETSEIKHEEFDILIKESNELLAITVASIDIVRRRINNK